MATTDAMSVGPWHETIVAKRMRQQGRPETIRETLAERRMCST